MALIVSEGEKREGFPIPSAETHQAVCFGVWPLGLFETESNGKKKLQEKVMLGWEVNESTPSGKRFTVFKKYTFSLFKEANLRKDLVSWRAKDFTPEELKGFDLEKLIGVNCMLSIIHNKVGEKTYANVGSISKLVKGAMPLKPETVSTETPDWIKKLQLKAVKDEPVQEGSDVAPEVATDANDEEIPF